MRKRLIALASVSLLSVSVGCGPPSARRADRKDSGSPAKGQALGRWQLLSAIARAEDARRPGEIPGRALSDGDVTVRRAAARAYARMPLQSAASLERALEDEDDEVVSFGAYGLGQACKGHEDERAARLTARLVALPEAAGAQASGVRPFRADVSIVRALGECGGARAEAVLSGLLSVDPERAEGAAFALGRIAGRARALTRTSEEALLQAAERTEPLEAALYPFDCIGADIRAPLVQSQARFVADALRALDRPSPMRVFAVRALETAEDAASALALASLLASREATPPERALAARALGHLGRRGQAQLALALPFLDDVKSLTTPGADGLNLVLAALSSLTTMPQSLGPYLWSLASARPPESAGAPTLRRLSALRCAAALHLARSEWSSDVLAQCDVFDGEAGDRARIEALDHRAMGTASRTAWLQLVRSRRIRVREAALDLVARHPELADAGRLALTEALGAPEVGVVATAAAVLGSHPERASTAGASGALDEALARALTEALARPFPADAVQTRVALVDAAVATGLPGADVFARSACNDANATVRARAFRALEAAGRAEKACAEPRTPESFTDRPDAPPQTTGPVRVSLDTDAGPLGLLLDPTLAPRAVTRIAAMARSGLYTGTQVHRVLPGFLAQFGDPGGDGFGGGGALLRCETSPHAFAAHDVGVALAGRDTGSSQLFVTLAREPQLDGEYTWVGRAEGDWDAVVEGDVIRSVMVEP